MSRRIIITFLASILGAMFFLTSAFLIISNLQKLELVRDKLRSNNEMIMNYMETSGIDPEILLSSADDSFRMTLIDARGNVLFDTSEQEVYENHLFRKEIQ